MKFVDGFFTWILSIQNLLEKIEGWYRSRRKYVPWVYRSTFMIGVVLILLKLVMLGELVIISGVVFAGVDNIIGWKHSVRRWLKLCVVYNLFFSLVLTEIVQGMVKGAIADIVFVIIYLLVWVFLSLISNSKVALLVIGDYFNLSINEEEAKVIRQMYKWYTEEGFGGAKIANMLNERGVKTKRGNNWSQNSVCRILTNEIYTGKIINGKEEVADFLTGQRKEKDESEWLVTLRPELRIIDDEIFDRAQEILKGRHDSFKMTHERQSNKHLFSTLIKCKDCGWSFRRTVRQYKNTYVRWVCSGHNGRGADSCPNAITVDEEELIQVLQEYFQDVLSKKKKVIDHVIREFQRVYKAKDENIEYEKELNAELNKLRKSREKYMDMYTDDLISREELNEKIGGMRKEIERLENELKMVSYHLTKGEQLEAILNSTFKEMEDITDVHEMTNTQLKRLINKIEVDKDGNVDIYLRLVGDLGLDETVLVEAEQENSDDSNKTVTKCINHT